MSAVEDQHLKAASLVAAPMQHLSSGSAMTDLGRGGMGLVKFDCEVGAEPYGMIREDF
jgi:hypothetical protein